MSICMGAPRKPNDPDGVCDCKDGTVLADLIGDALIGIGEAVCLVANKAVGLGLDIATSVIPGGIAVGAAEKAAVTAMKKATKIGGSKGVIDFCRGHKFKIVDPNAVEKVLPIR